jgi:uncharacterized protein YjbI with pentapeptide repeats
MGVAAKEGHTMEIRFRESGDTLCWLNAPSLREADLKGSVLAGADLRGARLDHADLRNVNLIGADLSRADLHGADLRGALLERAVLSGANLSHADLRGVNLAGAALGTTDLSEADLRGASLRGTKWQSGLFSSGGLDDADFSNADMRGANLSGWSPADFLRYYAVGIAGAIVYFLIAYYVWPARRAYHTFTSALGLALMTTVITYAGYGAGPDLRHVKLDGAVWDETTRWPWRFHPPADKAD